MINNVLYVQHLCEISSLAKKLEYTLNSLPSGRDNQTMEESEIRDALYWVQEKLEDTRKTIEYFSKAAKEGILKKNSSGKFEVHYLDSKESNTLSSGSSIEVYLNKDEFEIIECSGWYAGRVEHSRNGYYFYGEGNPRLYEGMKARTRGQ